MPLRRCVPSLTRSGRWDEATWAAALTRLDGVTIAPDRVTVAATTGTLSGTSGRAGAAAGIGVGAGAGVRGQVLHLERN